MWSSFCYRGMNGKMKKKYRALNALKRDFFFILFAVLLSIGNMWGTCENGTEAVGCGKPETFRNCADVRIVTSTGAIPPRILLPNSLFHLYTMAPKLSSISLPRPLRWQLIPSLILASIARSIYRDTDSVIAEFKCASRPRLIVIGRIWAIGVKRIAFVSHPIARPVSVVACKY